MQVDATELAESINEIRSSSEPAEIQTKDIDARLQHALEMTYPWPEYLFQPDRRKARVLNVSRFKPRQDRFYHQDIVEQIGKTRRIDLAELEKAGNGWLDVARNRMP